MTDVTMQASSMETVGRREAADLPSTALREDKLPLQGSVMLVVVASGAAWFVLATIVRWMFF